MNDDDAARIEYAKGMRIKANAPAAAWGCLLPLLAPSAAPSAPTDAATDAAMKYIQLIRDLFALVCAVYIAGLVLAGAVKALRHLAIAIDTNDAVFSLVLLAVGSACYLWLWAKEIM